MHSITSAYTTQSVTMTHFTGIPLLVSLRSDEGITDKQSTSPLVVDSLPESLLSFSDSSTEQKNVIIQHKVTETDNRPVSDSVCQKPSAKQHLTIRLFLKWAHFQDKSMLYLTVI